jgi:hypothetical protein
MLPAHIYQPKAVPSNSVIRMAIGLLSIAVVLVWFQRFFEYGQSPHYQAIRSIVFNVVTILPFALLIWVGHHLLSRWNRGSGFVWLFSVFLSGLVSVCIYMVLINPVLFFLGLSFSPFNEVFFEKYLTGAAALHVSVYWLVQVIYRRPETNKKTSQRIEVMDGATHVFIQHSDIAWIKSADHYLELATDNRKYLLRSTMFEIEAKLPPEFIRIHRRYIIHLPFVDQIRRKGRVMEVSIGEKMLPVSRSYQKRVLDKG